MDGWKIQGFRVFSAVWRVLFVMSSEFILDWFVYFSTTILCWDCLRISLWKAFPLDGCFWYIFGWFICERLSNASFEKIVSKIDGIFFEIVELRKLKSNQINSSRIQDYINKLKETRCVSTSRILTMFRRSRRKNRVIYTRTPEATLKISSKHADP